MAVYVAGCFHTRETEAVPLMNYIRDELGGTITHDWTSYELEYHDWFDRSQRCAEADVRGVLEADVMVALLTQPDYPYKGTRTEMGVAMGARYVNPAKAPKLWVLGSVDPSKVHKDKVPDVLKTCFTALVDRFFTSMEDLKDALRLEVAAQQRNKSTG